MEYYNARQEIDKRKKIKARKRIKKISLITALLLCLSAIIFFILIKVIGFLPDKYLKILGIVLIVVNLPWVLLGLIPVINSRQKKRQSIISVILCIFLLVGCVCVPVYRGKFERIFVEVPKEGNLNINVYVLKDSEYQSLEDLANQKVGKQMSLDLEYQLFATKAINKEIKGEDIVEVDCENIYQAAEKLLNHEVEAIVLNEAYAAIINDNAELSNFLQDTKVIFTVPTKVNIDIDISDVNVTQEPFVVAVTGVDEWSYNSIASTASVRSDVNIVLVANPTTKQVLMVTLPRDSYVNFVKQGSDAYDKLTHATIFGLDDWIAVLEDVLKVDVNYYLRVNFQSLADIVNAIGGINVENPYTFTTNAYVRKDEQSGKQIQGSYTYPEGPIYMDGEQALAYCRERKSLSNGDMGRNQHQAIVLKGCIDKVCSVSVITRITSLLDSLAGKFTSNFAPNDFYGLAKMQLDDMADWQIISYSVNGTNSWHTSYVISDTELAMVDLNQESVNKARSLIQKVLNDEMLEN